MLAQKRAASAPTSGLRSGAQGAPDHSRTEMSDLNIGQLVAVACSKVQGTGIVDAVTDDASVAWLHMHDGQGRFLIHTDDEPLLLLLRDIPS
jgi:hypothetical protein